MKSSEAAQEVLRTKCYYSPIFSITVTWEFEISRLVALYISH
jgi:hypothetical protein